MDSSFSGRKNITHMAQKYDTTEFIPLPFPDQDLPNHNQPQACARVPWAGPRASRPGRHRARTPRAGRLQVTGGRASPRPRGPGSPPAQRCAPGPSSPAHAAESRPETQRLEQRVQGRSPAGLRGPWAQLLAERPGLLPTADLSAPAKARFLCGGATPPSPPRTPFPPPPPRVAPLSAEVGWARWRVPSAPSSKAWSGSPPPPAFSRRSVHRPLSQDPDRRKSTWFSVPVARGQIS